MTPGWLHTWLAVASAVWLSACGPAVPADRKLLAELEPVVGPRVPEEIRVRAHKEPLDPRQRQTLRLARSQRDAVLTLEGLSWRATIPTDRRPRLEFEVAGMRRGREVAAGGAGEIVVELVRQGRRRELYRVPVETGRWTPHHVVVDEEGAAELSLSSTNGGPVAWSNVRLSWPGHASLPNLVLVSIDTLRSDHLSCYGYGRPTSPRLDSLAAESYLFTHSYSASTWTLPSTATLLSGLLPAQHGLRRVEDALADDVLTLAERLRDAGYHTAAITDGGYVGFDWGFAQGFERFDTTAGKAWQPKDVAKIAERVSRWLRENRFEPFFLLVHTYEVHHPYTNPEGFADAYLDPGYDGELTQEVLPTQIHGRGIPEADRDWAVALYDGEIARADHYLGGVLDTLRERDLFAASAVLVTSDHGEEFLDHGSVEHFRGKVFDEHVRVPMIFKPPGGGRGTISTPVHGTDVMPTLLELADLEPTPELVGRSLVRLIDEVDRDAPRNVLVHGLPSWRGQVEERLRLDVHSRSLVFDRVRQQIDLYDRARDPAMNDPRSPAGSVLVDRMQAILAWVSSGGGAFARLPPGVEGLRIPRSSAIQPIGVWDALHWRPLDRDLRELRLSGGPASLVFETAPEGDGLVLEVRRAGGGVESLRLRTGPPPQPGWTPLDGELPVALRPLPTAETQEAMTAGLSEAVREELRALGYLH